MDKKTLRAVLILYVTLTIAVGGLGSIVVWANRADIFNYFARQYLAERNQNNDDRVGGSGEANPARNLLSAEAEVVEAIEKANPAVVSIVVTKDVPVLEEYFDNFDPFGFFNFQIPRTRQNGTEKKEVGGGSGFFVSSDGLVVTNRHVVEDEKAEYTVLTNEGEKLEAEVLARDSVLDIAILQTKAKNTKFLEFEDSRQIRLGQTAIAIGNALGEFRNSVSVGVVSGLSRSIVAGDGMGRSEVLEEVIQTDAAINPGNSGGPLLNLDGRVIGVNVAVSRGAENIGFALPANVVASVVNSVEEHGEIVRPYLGVRYTLITPSMQEKNNLAVEYGAVVGRGESPEDLAVIPGSPADKAGIVENDIILEIDGVKIEEGHSLATIIRQKAVGDKIKIKLLSKGKEKIVEAILAKAPAD